MPKQQPQQASGKKTSAGVAATSPDAPQISSNESKSQALAAHAWRKTKTRWKHWTKLLRIVVMPSPFKTPYRGFRSIAFLSSPTGSQHTTQRGLTTSAAVRPLKVPKSLKSKVIEPYLSCFGLLVKLQCMLKNCASGWNNLKQLFVFGSLACWLASSCNVCSTLSLESNASFSWNLQANFFSSFCFRSQSVPPIEISHLWMDWWMDLIDYRL